MAHLLRLALLAISLAGLLATSDADLSANEDSIADVVQSLDADRDAEADGSNVLLNGNNNAVAPLYEQRASAADSTEARSPEAKPFWDVLMRSLLPIVINKMTGGDDNKRSPKFSSTFVEPNLDKPDQVNSAQVDDSDQVEEEENLEDALAASRSPSPRWTSGTEFNPSYLLQQRRTIKSEQIFNDRSPEPKMNQFWRDLLKSTVPMLLNKLTQGSSLDERSPEAATDEDANAEDVDRNLDDLDERSPSPKMDPFWGDLLKTTIPIMLNKWTQRSSLDERSPEAATDEDANAEDVDRNLDDLDERSPSPKMDPFWGDLLKTTIPIMLNKWTQRSSLDERSPEAANTEDANAEDVDRSMDDLDERSPSAEIDPFWRDLLKAAAPVLVKEMTQRSSLDERSPEAAEDVDRNMPELDERSSSPEMDPFWSDLIKATLPVLLKQRSSSDRRSAVAAADADTDVNADDLAKRDPELSIDPVLGGVLQAAVPALLKQWTQRSSDSGDADQEESASKRRSSFFGNGNGPYNPSPTFPDYRGPYFRRQPEANAAPKPSSRYDPFKTSTPSHGYLRRSGWSLTPQGPSLPVTPYDYIPRQAQPSQDRTNLAEPLATLDRDSEADLDAATDSNHRQARPERWNQASSTDEELDALLDDSLQREEDDDSEADELDVDMSHVKGRTKSKRNPGFFRKLLGGIKKAAVKSAVKYGTKAVLGSVFKRRDPSETNDASDFIKQENMAAIDDLDQLVPVGLLNSERSTFVKRPEWASPYYYNSRKAGTKRSPQALVKSITQALVEAAKSGTDLLVDNLVTNFPFISEMPHFTPALKTVIHRVLDNLNNVQLRSADYRLLSFMAENAQRRSPFGLSGVAAKPLILAYVDKIAESPLVANTPLLKALIPAIKIAVTQVLESPVFKTLLAGRSPFGGFSRTKEGYLLGRSNSTWSPFALRSPRRSWIHRKVVKMCCRPKIRAETGECPPPQKRSPSNHGENLMGHLSNLGGIVRRIMGLASHAETDAKNWLKEERKKICCSDLLGRVHETQECLDVTR